MPQLLSENAVGLVLEQACVFAMRRRAKEAMADERCQGDPPRAMESQ